jgi:hypothetical protein
MSPASLRWLLQDGAEIKLQPVEYYRTYGSGSPQSKFVMDKSPYPKIMISLPVSHQDV